MPRSTSAVLLWFPTCVHHLLMEQPFFSSCVLPANTQSVVSPAAGGCFCAPGKTSIPPASRSAFLPGTEKHASCISDDSSRAGMWSRVGLNEPHTAPNTRVGQLAGHGWGGGLDSEGLARREKRRLWREHEHELGRLMGSHEEQLKPPSK